MNRLSLQDLTFWWTETEKQVRIQGDAVRLSELDAKDYFSKRSQDSKIVSTAFEQGKNQKGEKKI